MAGDDGTPEPRRSGRSTKGQHTRNAELNEEPPVPVKKMPTKKATPSTPASATKAPTPTPVEKATPTPKPTNTRASRSSLSKAAAAAAAKQVAAQSASPTATSATIDDRGASTAPSASAATDKNDQDDDDATAGSDSDDGELIRCVCGAVKDEGGRQMIMCDICNAWQHSSCMQIPTKHTPEEYFCEQCKPELHKELLEKMAKGEKPWERRSRKGGRKSVGGGSTRKKRGSEAPEGTPATEAGTVVEDGGDQGEQGEQGDVKMESPADTTAPTEGEKEVEVEAEVEASVPAPAATIAESEPAAPVEPTETTEEPQPETVKAEENDVEMKDQTPPEQQFEKPAIPTETGRRRSSVASPTALKRKADELAEEGDSIVEESPSRKASIPQSPTQAKNTKARNARRASAANLKAPPPKKPKTASTTENQTELVTTLEELKSDIRRKAAETLKKFFDGSLKKLEKLPEGETSKQEYATKLALEIEHYTYMLLSAAIPGEPNDDYRAKLRSIMFNLKKNAPLLSDLLSKEINTKDFSDMDGDAMATEKMKHIVQEAEKESEKQSTLTIEASGPRIRRTHKGEEVVGEDNNMIIENSTGFIGTRYEPPPEKEDNDDNTAPPSPAADDTEHHHVPRSPSPGAEDPAAVETTPSKALKIDIASATKPVPPSHHRRTSSFDINNVWSNVESTDVEKGHRGSISRPPVTPLTAYTANGNKSQLDRDIDMLLQNDGGSPGSETPPYSPQDYTDEADKDVVWKGRILMRGVGDIEAQAAHVAGVDISAKVPWTTVIGNAIEITGRISVDRAKEYLCQLKFSSRSSDFVVFALQSSRGSGATGSAGFNKLFSHFKERQRSGVVGKPTWSPTKDVYVVAVGKDEPMPEYMLESQFQAHPRECDVLLLCIVFNRNLEPFHDTYTPTGATPSGASATPQPPPRHAHTPVTVPRPGEFHHHNHQIPDRAAGGGGWQQPPFASGAAGYQASPTPANYYPQPQQDHQYQPPAAAMGQHLRSPPTAILGANSNVVEELMKMLNLSPGDQAMLRNIIVQHPEASGNPEALMQLVQQYSQQQQRPV